MELVATVITKVKSTGFSIVSISPQRLNKQSKTEEFPQNRCKLIPKCRKTPKMSAWAYTENSNGTN
jgi:hypothetical protein